MADGTNTQQNILDTSLPPQMGGQPEKLQQQTDRQSGQLDVATFLDGVRGVLRSMDTDDYSEGKVSTETVLARINSLIDQLPDTLTPGDVDTIASASMHSLKKGMKTLGTSREMSIAMGNEQLTQYTA